jgi:hypothetical protein
MESDEGLYYLGGVYLTLKNHSPDDKLVCFPTQATVIGAWPANLSRGVAGIFDGRLLGRARPREIRPAT